MDFLVICACAIPRTRRGSAVAYHTHLLPKG